MQPSPFRNKRVLSLTKQRSEYMKSRYLEFGYGDVDMGVSGFRKENVVFVCEGNSFYTLTDFLCSSIEFPLSQL